MKRVTLFLLLALLILIAVPDPILSAGNKFTKIGGGVVGSHREKIEYLKSLSAIFGAFLTLLGILSFATRSRFEGLIGIVTGKLFEAVTVVPIVMIIMGTLMVLAYFFL